TPPLLVPSTSAIRIPFTPPVPCPSSAPPTPPAVRPARPRRPAVSPPRPARRRGRPSPSAPVPAAGGEPAGAPRRPRPAGTAAGPEDGGAHLFRSPLSPSFSFFPLPPARFRAGRAAQPGRGGADRPAVDEQRGRPEDQQRHRSGGGRRGQLGTGPGAQRTAHR